MSLKDSVLNIVIRAKDQAAGTFGKIRNSLKRTDKDTNTLGASMRRLGATIAGLAGAYLSIEGLRRSFAGILRTGADFEKFRAQLDQVMGSIEGGEQATEWIKRFTRETPFELDQVTQGFIKLKSFGLDPMDGTYEALANQAAALGGDQETLNGIILATGQAWAKQKLQGEEILQLVERGVPVWDLLGEATGRSAVELQKMSEAGQLGRKEIALLINEIGRASDGALQAQMGTLNGLVSNVRDQWTQFTATIADSGLQEYVKGVLADLIEQFNRLRENGTLARWAKQISDAFISLGETIRQFSTRVVGDIDTFGDRAAGALSTFANATRGALAGARLFANGIGAAFNAAVLGVSAALGSLSDSFASFLESAGADELAQTFRGVADTADATANEYSNRLRQNNANIKESFADLADTMISEGERGAQGAAQKQAEAARVTGDALRQAVDQAQAQNERLRGELDKINGEVDQAVENTRQAWAAAYRTSGEAKAEAMVELNAAIQEENQLRRDAANKAVEYNDAVAESEGLVARLAAEKAEEQRKAAEQARGSLQRLGIDTGLAFDQISSAAGNSIAALETIAEEIRTIGPESEGAARAFEQGMTEALENVSTAEEFDAIREQIDALRETDLIDDQVAAQALQNIRVRQQEVNQERMNASTDALGESLDSAATKADQLGDAAEQAGVQAEAAGESASGAFDGFGAALTTARETVSALSSAARQLFEQRLLGDDYTAPLDDARARLEAARQEVNELNSASLRLRNNSFASWFNDVALNAARTKQEFYEQKVAMDSLIGSIDAGTFSLSELDNIAGSTSRRFDLLDDQSLSGLQSAIDAAKSKLESLNASAESTLNSLQQRLANLQGDAEEAARLQYEQERARLQQQLEDARQAGADQAEADYARALQQLDQIRNIERQQAQEAEQERQRKAEERQREEAAAARQEAQSRQQASTTTNQQDSQRPAGQTIVLQALDGSRTEVTTNDPDGLLRTLEQSGLRSAT